jgi:RNA-binding protein PNO1
MVVSHPSQPESSASPSTARKNRRRIPRKAPRTIDRRIPLNATEDEVMDNAETSALEPSNQAILSGTTDTDDDAVMIDTDPTLLPQATAPAFPPLSANAEKTRLKSETRRIAIPPHRMTPLKKDWINIFGPLTEILGLQVRMNVQRRCVEARVCAVLLFFDAS